MKKFFAVLALISMSAAAQASTTTLTVRAEKADAIIDALAGAGVKHHQGQELSEWKVTQVRMEYSRGFMWSQGELKDEVSGLELLPITTVSYAIYAALVDAGVQVEDLSQGGLLASEVKAKSIACARGYNIGAHAAFSQCEIEL